MSKKIRRTAGRVTVGLTAAIILGLTLQAQQTDPFYLRALNSGERLFQSGDYAAALRSLEIASFGLMREKDLTAKAFLLMSLCANRLEKQADSETYLRKALNLISPRGYLNLGLPASAVTEIETLVKRFRLEGSVPSPQTLFAPQPKTTPALPQSRPPVSSPSAAPITESDISPSDELERRLSEDPTNISLYYDLARSYARHQDLGAARHVLESLIQRYPDEITGRLLMARMEMSQGMFPQSLQNSLVVIKSSNRMAVTENLLARALIYAAVAYSRLESSENLQLCLELIADLFTETEVSGIVQEDGLADVWSGIGSGSPGIIKR